MLLGTYGHHQPNYLSDAVEKIARHETKIKRKPTEIVSRAITGTVGVRSVQR